MFMQMMSLVGFFAPIHHRQATIGEAFNTGL
jgi:hypothetical protein